GSRSVFIAKAAPVARSRTFHTAPIPPRPSGSRTSNRERGRGSVDVAGAALALGVVSAGGEAAPAVAVSARCGPLCRAAQLAVRRHSGHSPSKSGACVRLRQRLHSSTVALGDPDQGPGLDRKPRAAGGQAGGPQSAAAHPLKNASRSSLTRSLRVEGSPCGAPL